MVFWIVEAEELYEHFHTEINRLYSQFLLADYNMDWASLLQMFYVRYFLRWIVYLCYMIENNIDLKPIVLKGSFLVNTVIPAYSVLLQRADRADFMKALTMDGLDECLEAVPFPKGELSIAVNDLAFSIDEPHRIALPDSDKLHIEQFMSKPEIEIIYRRICSFEGDYARALSEALDNTFLMQLPYAVHGLTLSCCKIIIERLDSDKHPGLIKGVMMWTFMHEFSHYLRRYHSSIGQFYTIESPRFTKTAQERFNNLTKWEQPTPDNQEYTPQDIAIELETFMMEASQIASKADEEEAFNWSEYLQQRAATYFTEQLEAIHSEQSSAQPHISTLMKSRPIASEILTLCPMRRIVEGGAAIEMEIVGDLYPCITVEAAKVLISAGLRQKPVNFPQFYERIRAGMQALVTSRASQGLYFQRGAEEIVESRNILRFSLLRHGFR